MGAFCTGCGRPLAKGEVCACQLRRVPRQRAGVPEQGGNRPGMPGASSEMMRKNQMGQPARSHAAGGMEAAGRAPNRAIGRTGAAQSAPSRAAGSRAAQSAPSRAAGNRAAQSAPNRAAGSRTAQNVSNRAGGEMGAGQFAPLPSEMERQTINQQTVATHASRTIGMLLHMVKSPVRTGRQLMACADLSVILILLLLQAVASGLFDVAVMAKISGLAMGYLKMPVLRSFLVTALGSLALSFLLAALLFGGGRILKIAVTYRQMLACVAVRSVLLVMTTLIAIAVFFLYPAGGFFFYLAGSLWGLSAIATLLSGNVAAGREDQLALMQFVVSVLFLLFFIVMAKLCQKAYVPDAISALGGGLDALMGIF